MTMKIGTQMKESQERFSPVTRRERMTIEATKNVGSNLVETHSHYLQSKKIELVKILILLPIQGSHFLKINSRSNAVALRSMSKC